jgi:hypothetical protein
MGRWTMQGWPVHGSTVDSTMVYGSSSPELSLTVAPGRGGLPRGWQGGEDDMAHSGDRSPKLGRRRGGGVMTVKWR